MHVTKVKYSAYHYNDIQYNAVGQIKNVFSFIWIKRVHNDFSELWKKVRK